MHTRRSKEIPAISLGIVGGTMTLKEVLETKVIGLIPIGECNCGCGEEMYDLITNNNLAYQPLSRKVIGQVRPDLLEEVKGD